MHAYPAAEIGAKRPSELAIALAEEGFDVTLVSCVPARVDNELSHRIARVRQVRIPLPRKILPRVIRVLYALRGAQKRNAACRERSEGSKVTAPTREGWLQRSKRYFHSMNGLIDSYKLWSALAFLWCIRERLRSRFDVIVSSGPPMSPHCSALAASRINDCPWIIDLRDPWLADGHRYAEVDSGLRRRIESAIAVRCLRRAARIVCTSPGIAAEVSRAIPAVGARVEVVMNGYDADVAPAVAPPGRLWLVYAGSLYFNRNPFPLLAAFTELVAAKKPAPEALRFAFIGDCREWEGRSVADWVDANGMNAFVEIVDTLPRASLRRYMNEASVLVNLAQGQERQIPGKTFEYIGFGKEILHVSEQGSDSSRVVREARAGVVADSRDQRELTAALNDLYERYVERRLTYVPGERNQYSRSAQNRRFVELVAGANRHGAVL
jgi:glycosyltransferase involved in cell wall biosynthesis